MNKLLLMQLKFKTAIPSTEVNRCFFIYPNACGVIFRNLACKKDSEDPEFVLLLRMLPALAFVPKDDVINS